MRVLKLILIFVALLGAAGQYVQERRRLGVVQRLSGPAARDHYEATRERGERMMLVVTAALVVAAVVALGRALRRW